MAVESNYAIAIATVRGWLKSLTMASFSNNDMQNQNQNQSHLVPAIFLAP